MAELETLSALIYHERQQEGSMLCAQHALNSLLQGNYFTAPDLAAIAHSYDTLEQDALGGEEIASTNMDDSGFFSVQVMEKALEVWGLSLVRWRSEQMRPFNTSPHTQLAFVLNLHQHWFTLRRFGPALSDASRDPGNGLWYNLNSNYDRPKWVSRTYLGMFLEQSEQEGYSVFAVVQTDPSKPLALPRTEADNIAASLQAPDSASSQSSHTGIAHDSEDNVVIPPETDYDMGEEDMELQAALAASLGGEGIHDYSAYAQAQAAVPPLAHSVPMTRTAPVVSNDDDNGDYIPEAPPPSASEAADPVAASMARGQALLERMLREQEAAFREGFEDHGGAVAAAAESRRRREEAEEAELRAAIAASMVDHPPEEGGEGAESGSQTPPAPAPAVAPPPRSIEERPRVYDDEDAELQAALRASLAALPPGFVHPPAPPQPPAPARPPAASTASTQQIPPPSSSESEFADDVSMTSSQPPTPARQLDVDEIRRRRLARFGGGNASNSSSEQTPQT